MSTENRNRVQPGVSTGGQFAKEARTEADVTLEARGPEHEPIELEDGGFEDIEADGSIFREIYVENDNGEYRASGTPDHLDLAYLLDAIDDDREPTEAFESVITHERQWAIEQFVKNRYADVYTVDSGADSHLLPVEVGKTYESAPSEKQVVDDLYETGARLANETDPGTFDSEFLGRLLKDDLDSKAFAPKYPTQHNNEWLGEAPASMETVVEEETAWMEDNSKLMSDRAVIAQAKHASISSPEMAEFSRTGYMDRDRLAAAASGIGLDAMAAWANSQPTTSELLQSEDD